MIDVYSSQEYINPLIGIQEYLHLLHVQYYHSISTGFQRVYLLLSLHDEYKIHVADGAVLLEFS